MKSSVEIGMLSKMNQFLVDCYSGLSSQTILSNGIHTPSSPQKLVSEQPANFRRLTASNSPNELIVNRFDDPVGPSEYDRAIYELNLLQSNTQVIGLAKYKNPKAILPLFRKQLQLSGINVDDLKRLNILHITGTKGKGSTCAFTESILRRAGLKTGFYNSPHLVRVTERIRLNGRPIEDSLFAKYFRTVHDRLIRGTKNENITMPSYFSFLTILAFHVFLEEKVDCAVIEVGIGGEYDPTNIIEQPVACGISTLDLDHTNILGDTIEKIAWNKAGIMKPGRPTFTIRHDRPGAMQVLEERAKEKGAPLHICGPISREDTLELGIKSSAQYLNASLACQLANCLLQHRGFGGADELLLDPLDISRLPAYFRAGLEGCDWPGRCQIVDFHDRISFFLDGAHTRKSMENCLEWFRSSSKIKDEKAQQILMINVIGERDKIEVMRPLSTYDNFDYVIFSTNRVKVAEDTPKSETFASINCVSKGLENVKSNARVWADLKRDSANKTGERIFLEQSTFDAVKSIQKIINAERKTHVLATGSLHFVGAVLETLESFPKCDQ